MNLREFLQEHLTCISEAQAPKPHIYVLSDCYDVPTSETEASSHGHAAARFMNYTPKRFRDEFMARKHLILIYQGSSIVLGMTVFEYAHVPVVQSDVCTLRWSRAYIQYIDSTGLYASRQNQSHLTKSLVRAYVLYCARELKMDSLHLLATAKPAFLFAGSEFIEQKRALPAVKLVNWWLGVTERIVEEDSLTDAEVFVFAPFEEATGSARMRKRISAMNNPRWKYGVPYDAKAPCVDHVPFFEDDPKWRHFEASVLDDDEVIEAVERCSRKKPKIILDSDSDDPAPPRKTNSDALCKMTIKEFFASLQVRPEFRDAMAAFIVVQFRSSSSSLFDDVTRPQEEASQAGTRSDLATFGCRLLSTLTFESPVAAKKSSQKISSWMKLMAVSGTEIKGIPAPTPTPTAAESKHADENVPPPAVNSIQTLVKRKTTTKQQ